MTLSIARITTTAETTCPVTGHTETVECELLEAEEVRPRWRQTPPLPRYYTTYHDTVGYFVDEVV